MAAAFCKRAALIVLTGALVVDGLLVGASAQPPVRRAATIEAIRTYAGFFHAQAVTLQGRIVARGAELALVTEAPPRVPPSSAAPSTTSAG
ncbi:MAG: hypothetical protein LC791_06390 [Acidobacteria bacterium]|nr:hypothetical protein [Acidobacteriota bacterium]